MIVGLSVIAGVGCAPQLDDRGSLVAEPRVLAVQAEPAEAAPGQAVRLSALWVGPEGELDGADLSWAHCLERKPLAELGPVNPRCLETEAVLESLGEGTVIDAPLPRNACRLFGPETPEAVAGEPPGRPVDADETGGYFLPTRLWPQGESPSFARLRLACGLASATGAQMAEYSRRYKPNTNPVIEALERIEDRGAAFIEGELSVEAGASVRLRARWPGCEDGPPCAGAEPYVVFDRVRREIVDRRETLSLSWFSTAGSFENARTGRDEEDAERWSTNVWTAPSEAGEVVLWIVLRDSRGGVGWTRLRVVVG